MARHSLAGTSLLFSSLTVFVALVAFFLGYQKVQKQECVLKLKPLFICTIICTFTKGNSICYFGQSGGSSDESDDDDYIPDTAGNLDVQIDDEQELLSLSDNTCDHQNDNGDDRSDYSDDDVPIATRLAAQKKGKSR